jgi:predicted O-methyltransferase YrrM
MSENTVAIEGQLNAAERELLTRTIRNAPKKPEVALEVGTWLGGGSTLHILRALEANGKGRLWGIEADPSIYEQMTGNIRSAGEALLARFTPLFGFSHNVIPEWLRKQPPDFHVDLAFLDGGNSPREQIIEFQLLDPYMPVGSTLMAHDAKLRKGKWLVPYVSLLDNWESRVENISQHGLFYAQKKAPQPSEASRKRAECALLKMRMQPVELIAAITPRKVCGAILNILPVGLRRALAEGRK